MAAGTSGILGGIQMSLQGATHLEQKLTKMALAVDRIPDLACEAAGRVYEFGMKRRCPVGRTGDLHKSIKYRALGHGVGQVGTAMSYAADVEYGTGLHTVFPGASPHRIVPTTKQALSWMSYSGRGLKGGSVVTVASTEGMTPRPFFRPTFHEDTPLARAAARRVMKGTLGGAKL